MPVFDIDVLCASLIHEPHCPVPRAIKRGEGAVCLCQSSSEARAKDALMMQSASPDHWPAYPRLPLRNRFGHDHRFRGAPKLGLLVADAAGTVQPKVYLADCFELGEHVDFQHTDLSNAPTKTYANFHELIADGWLVD